MHQLLRQPRPSRSRRSPESAIRSALSANRRKPLEVSRSLQYSDGHGAVAQLNWEMKMNSLNKTTNGIAGFVAILATVLICGGTLSLAEHYARSGTGGQEMVVASHQMAPIALNRTS